MISVRNHRLPLSGNKILWVCFLLVFFSCASTHPSNRGRSPRILKPDKSSSDIGQSEATELSVDTIHWILMSETEVPPITSDLIEGGALLPLTRREKYNIAVLIPFRINDDGSSPLTANNRKFAHFYAGLKQAAMEASQDDDTEIVLTVYNTNRDQSTFQLILDRLTRYKPDLIVGPYETSLISEAAQFAKENRIPLISPWKASTRVTSDNIFYLQLRPNITEYYKNMVLHINRNFDRSEVRIIGRDTGEDDSKIKVIQELNEKESYLPVVQPYGELLINSDSLMIADSLIFNDVFEENARVFILPNFSSRDESYLYSCLRKLYAEKGDLDIYVYAMPLALSAEQLDINILKNLKIRVCEYKFADTRSPNIQRIRKDYFTHFGWLPNGDSYFGYDVMNFILFGLKNYGKYFHYYMSGEKIDLSQMSIHIAPYHRPDSNRLEYLMNNHLYMIEFEKDHYSVHNID